MPCLVALQPLARPGGRRRPPTSATRRGRTLAAHPCGCRCGRRCLIGASALLPLVAPPSPAAPPVDPEVMLERVHPSRPDWYEEFYATAMDQGMKSYEAEIAGYKAKLFSQLSTTGKSILELGVGTGPNFKYYASDSGVNIIGVDPNKHMEDYARTAAVSAGLPSSSFTFKRGVAEALPAEDNSMDVVIGTLVLCSVNNIDMALRDGSLLRFVQGAFDPLQQFVADGCHLTRKTGENIRDVGFSSLSLDSVRLSNAYIISPHVYGVASK
ncbi:methyltransferase-like protein 7A isoform X2 [Panicum virgatum]|uniref:methyltransferase-like protein 7A isoform X2 n=1 Tax=Panicum virgatum TaxID=38727 RepID=UPI0019D625A7|nr:methyltransferase-like protein 7A isoform X2 [Panicum virgatum]